MDYNSISYILRFVNIFSVELLKKVCECFRWGGMEVLKSYLDPTGRFVKGMQLDKLVRFLSIFIKARKS